MDDYFQPDITNPGNYEKSRVLLDELEEYYGRVLSAAGLNTADPISANMGYFNNSSRIIVDSPRLGKTYVFVTRPNMNFRAKTNIYKARAFNYLTSSKLGITLARMLQYPSIASTVNFGGIKDLSWGATSGRANGISLVGTAGCGIVGGIGGKDPTDEDTIERNGMSYPLSKTNFLPMLTNACTETGNGKDLILDTEETEGDYSGNKLTYGSGLDESMGPGEITLTFDDFYGSPIMNLLILWVYYIHYVAKGIVTPERAYICNRIIDYSCSIYVFMLDTDQQTILRWTKYCGCFPRSIPFGQIMHTHEINLQALSQIQIPFAYNFACPMDPVVLQEFNMIAEPALLIRKPGWTDDPEDKTKNPFALANHRISFEQAMEFFYKYPPNINDTDYKQVPKPLISAAKFKSGKADGLTDQFGPTINSNGGEYQLRNNVNGWSGEAASVGAGIPTEEKDSIMLWPNKYFGTSFHQYGYGRMPYIADGNKLVFI